MFAPRGPTAQQRKDEEPLEVSSAADLVQSASGKSWGGGGGGSPACSGDESNPHAHAPIATLPSPLREKRKKLCIKMIVKRAPSTLDANGAPE